MSSQPVRAISFNEGTQYRNAESRFTCSWYSLCYNPLNVVIPVLKANGVQLALSLDIWSSPNIGSVMGYYFV